MTYLLCFIKLNKIYMAAQLIHSDSRWFTLWVTHSMWLTLLCEPSTLGSIHYGSIDYTDPENSVTRISMVCKHSDSLKC